MTAPAKLGRRTLLTDKLQAELLQYIEEGHTYGHAAALVGIHVRTLENWLRWGREAAEAEEAGEELTADQRRFSTFVVEVEKARATAVRGHLHNITSAGFVGNWQASAWFLERRYAQEYGRKTIIAGDEAAPVKVEVSAKETLTQKLAAMLERAEANANLLSDAGNDDD